MPLDIIVNTKDFVHLLGLSSTVVEKRNVIPILSNIKLEVKDSTLTVTATDMDISLQQSLTVQAKDEGAITVPAQTFSEIIRKIPDPDVVLRFLEDGQQLYISSTNCEFTLSTLPADSFPLMEDIGAASHIETDARKVVEILEHTKFAISTEETRYNLNGVYLHVLPSSPSMLTAAATDIHRLSISSIDIEKKMTPFGIILPRKTVHELLKILKDPVFIEKRLDIHFGQNRVKFVCGAVSLISKLIDGSFPEYHVFIPSDNPNKITISGSSFAAAVDRVATITIDKHRAVKIICEENRLEIHAHGGDTRGAAHEVLMVGEETKYEGDSVSIGFNPRYILETLSAAGTGIVTIEFADASSPALLKAEEFPNATFVVMPIKV
ncbi:MAG: DNA polymerase III subunit beta [Rickettsiaceae bacterium]|nr:DNA polymerase III subunit beta [Rickettsiaceae bacterium]